MPEHPPHIVVTDSAGVATAFLLRQGSTIRRDPASGQTQTTTIGESDRRGDTRTPEVIFTDMSEGMGQFEYEEINGVSSFTESTCDTRYQGIVCLPPATTALGALSYATFFYEMERANAPSAILLAWVPTNSSHSPWRWVSGTTWTSIAAINSVFGYCRYGAYFIFATTMANGLWYSTDGATWTNLVYGKQMHGCCAHDNKLYIWNSTDSRIEWTTNPTVAAFTASSSTLPLKYAENVTQIVEWQRGGRAMIFICTSQRVFWYDEDADAYLAYDDFAALVSDTAFPRVRVRRSDGNMYLVLGDTTTNDAADTAIWYAGNTTYLSPNKRGGMLAASRVQLVSLCDSLYSLFFWGRARFGTGNLGRTLALGGQGGWHTVLTGTSGAARVAGGTAAQGNVYTILSDGTVWQQTAQDSRELPLYADGRTYPTSGTYQHEYAYTDGGTENILKRALWVTVGARDMTVGSKAAGTPANTSITVEYLRSVDTTWTSIGTLTHASTFPAVLPIASGFGVSFRQIKLRLTLATTDPNSTPIVTSVALAYQRVETIRDAYTLEVDLRPTGHPLYQGLDRAQLLARLDAYRALGTPVSLAFAGGEWLSQPAGARNMPRCGFSYGGVEDPDSGPGVYQCQFIDSAAPASGDG